MRIGVDLRMLSAGGLTVHRGMGRYTRQQLREVLRIDSRNEYVLLCRQDADLTALEPDIAGASNVSIAWLPPLGGRSGREMNRPEDVLRATGELQRVLDAQDLDVFHLTTPGHLDDLVPFGLDGPLVATHYDLIPWNFPSWYLGEPGRQDLYERALRLVRRADRLVAISEHVALEASEALDVPREHVRVAPPLADPCFRPLPEEERERILAPLRERLGLSGGFLLTVSHLHHAKNLRGLFDAYALLAPAARREMPLVLACELHPAQADTVRGWARERGIEADLALTGFVADEELVALYNAATMYVHASLAEGFGLPALEAMRCGAAVVAASTSSLPEVVGDAGLLADPASPAGLARALEQLRSDPALRCELGERALARAAARRDEDLGRETLAAYEEAAHAGRERAASSGGRLRLALWTPVPPQESGISDYSVELARELVRRAEVEVFADDGVLPAPEVAELAPVHVFTSFGRRHARRPFDAALVQLGASYFHLYMDEALRSAAALPPVILTLHDLTWGALLYREASLWGREEELRRTLAASEGEEAAAEHAALGTGDPATLPDRVEAFLSHHLLLGRLIAASRAQIVHLPRAAAELEERYPGARAFDLPMGVEDPRSVGADGGALRRRLGIADGAFLVGTFGVADPVKRLDVAVRALARLRSELPESDPALLVVGGFHDPGYRERLEALAAELGVAERVHLLGRTGREDFDRALLACDAVVNLRYPFRHQMSATLMRALAAGRPVVISDVPAWAFFPESFCLRVAPDAKPDGQESEALFRHLLALARDPARRREMGEAARRHWEENATPARMAEGYLRIVSEVVDGPWRSLRA